MLQLGRRPGITQEHFRFERIEKFLAGDFHRHGALQFRVARFPHAAESTGADFLQELEPPQHLHAGRVRARGARRLKS